MNTNKHEKETISGPSQEAEASQGNRQAPKAVTRQTSPEAVSTPPTKSGSNKKTRGPAVIHPKMRNLRNGAPFNGHDYKDNEDYTSFKPPLSRRVALAAHYIDRSISPEFTAAVMSFLHQNWDESLPMGRQPWYRKLKSKDAPDMVEFEAARVVNGGEIPDGISEAVNFSGHNQKWLTEQQKNIINEQQQKVASEKKRKTAGAPSNVRADKKSRKSYDDEDDVVEL